MFVPKFLLLLFICKFLAPSFLLQYNASQIMSFLVLTSDSSHLSRLILSFFCSLVFIHSFQTSQITSLFKSFLFASLRLPLSTFFNYFSLCASPPTLSSYLSSSLSFLSSSPDIDLSSFPSSSPPPHPRLCSEALPDLSESVRSLLSLDSPRQPLPPFSPPSRAGYYVLSQAEINSVHWSYH